MIGWLIRVVMGCLCGKETVDIDGRQYYLKKRLAEGGFSMVYLVEERKTGKHYALKRIVCHSARDEKRVLDEINLHKRLEMATPNILPCIGYGSSKVAAHRAVLYEHETNLVVDTVEYNILLPYHKRGTLLEELTFRQVSGDRIPELRVLRLFVGVCQAVKALHDLQPEPYAHRDIKPGNVLLSIEDDMPILMDLGSAAPARQIIKDAREAQTLKDYAAEHCSMCYRAPELFHAETGTAISEKTDIWALGCLLYAMCFFKSPFDSIHEKGDSVHLAVLNGSISFPAKSCYKEGVLKLIEDMIRVSPEERPSIDRVLERVMILRSDKPVV